MYDTLEKIQYINFFYFGLQYGPEWMYDNQYLTEYLFSDFDRKVIVECNYDKFGKVEIKSFKMAPVITLVKDKGVSLKKLFAYLPVLPNTIQEFSLGQTNSKHEMRELTKINLKNDYFIDTLLTTPEKGWHYYIACALQANKDSINTFYIEEFVDNEEIK